MKKIFFAGLVVLLALNCIKSKYTMKRGADLNAYRNVVIVPPKRDPYNGYLKLSSLFTQTGFNVVLAVDKISATELSRTLMCIYTWADGLYSVTAQIQMTDTDLNTVYVGKGEYGHSLNRANDVANALEQAFKGVATEYRGFSEQYAEKLPESEKIAVDRKTLVQYLDANINKLDAIEGIWSEEKNLYNIGIFRDTTSESRDFVAVVLDAESDRWQKGDIKVEFLETAYSGTYTTTYFMGNKSKQGSTARIDENGFLKIPLRHPTTGSAIEGVYIKNYPKNVGSGYYSGTQPSAKHLLASGSGFLLHKKGLVVTNYHVVENASKIEVIFPESEITKTAVIRLKDKNNDIAILELKNFDLADITAKTIPFRLANINSIKVGQEVFTLGFPLGSIMGTKSRLSAGRINSLYGLQDDPRLFQISNPLQPGNSGGPLFNNKGELVGIVVSGLNAKYFYENIGIIPQNVNFGIKGSYIENLISMMPEGDEILNRKNLVTQITMEKQIEQLNPFIVQVRIY